MDEKDLKNGLIKNLTENKNVSIFQNVENIEKEKKDKNINEFITENSKSVKKNLKRFSSLDNEKSSIYKTTNSSIINVTNVDKILNSCGFIFLNYFYFSFNIQIFHHFLLQKYQFIPKILFPK
jgi:hypothetical protein